MDIDFELILKLLAAITAILLIPLQAIKLYTEMLTAKIKLKETIKKSTFPNSRKVKGRRHH